METNESKKIIIPTVLAIVTLIVLTVGATYAYFTFSSDNEFGTQTIEASTGAIGSGVSLSKVDNSDLVLNVTAQQMLQQAEDVPYYASGSATPQNVGKITVLGAGTFDCTYEMTVTKSSTAAEKDLYTKFQALDDSKKTTGQIYFTLNEQTYDFNTAGLFSGDNSDTITYTGSVNGITSAQDVFITANLAIVNSSTIDQTELNDSDIKLTFNVSDFKCTLVGE